MKLIHLSTIKNVDGLYDVSVQIDNKEYTYHINSEYAVQKFGEYTRRSETFGRAVAILNKFKVSL